MARKKKFLLRAREIKPILETRMGCIASDRITVDGEPIGYMYRETTDGSYPDSGWRFLSGDETQEYLDNPENSSVLSLNTLANYDKGIIPLLNCPCGTAFIRDPKTGKLILDQNGPDMNGKKTF